jgi:hypothetical protein
MMGKWKNWKKGAKKKGKKMKWMKKKKRILGNAQNVQKDLRNRRDGEGCETVGCVFERTVREDGDEELERVWMD